MINHEYKRIPKINKNKTGKKIIRSTKDKNTKTYVLDNSNFSTNEDTGGESIIKGESKELVEVLKLLKKRTTVKSMDIVIDNPPEVKNSKLSDGITKPQYAIGKVMMVDGRDNCVIEREEKALSILFLKVNNLMNWKRICSILIIGLVDESGKWSNEEID